MRKLTKSQKCGLCHLAIGGTLLSWWGMYQLPRGAPTGSDQIKHYSNIIENVPHFDYGHTQEAETLETFCCSWGNLLQYSSQ